MLSDRLPELLAALMDSSVELPAEVQTRARWLVLDTLGCAIAGGRAETVRTWLDSHGLTAHPFATPADGRYAGPLGPAMALTMGACWDEACEGHAGAHGRPGVAALGAIWPSVPDLTWEQMIRAVVVGYEVGARAGAALRMATGEHVDGNWPALGAAAAAACAMGLKAPGPLTAINVAACQLPTSLYRPVQTGDTARNTYLGHAAVLGRMAAESVAAGITAPPDAIEAYRRVTGGAGRAEPVRLDGYQILAGYFKEYAAVRHVHYAARAALELRSVTAAEDITSIEVWTYPEAIRYCGVRHPDTPLQAQFSLSFGVAAMLRWGRLDPAVYRNPDFGDPLLRDLERKVVIRAPGEWAPADWAPGEWAPGEWADADWADTRAARVAVTDSTGRVADATVSAVRGDESLPWSEADLVGKFLDYSGPSLGRAAAEALAEHVLRASPHAKVFG